MTEVAEAGVLVCDDAAFTRSVLIETLIGAGHRVLAEAVDGIEAVRMYREVRPDVVTLDIVMPRMGGIEALREILRMDPAARVVMCSALAQKAIISEALSIGAREFVVKPFHSARILDAVQRALG